MPDKLFMPTHPSSPFSHAHTRTHHQPDSSPPGLAQWACYMKASAYGSRVGWTPARTIHTYIHTCGSLHVGRGNSSKMCGIQAPTKFDARKYLFQIFTTRADKQSFRKS